jgi:hypothetical protein
MRRRGVLSFAVLLAVLGGIWALSAVLSGGAGLPSVQAGRDPALILRDVEVREVRRDGRHFRLFSETATYRLPARTLSGSGVTLTLPEDGTRLVLRAPAANWDMDAGTIRLPEGCSAASDDGWSASLAAALVSLPDHLLSGEGRSNLYGPGLSVAGDNLVWRWRERKLMLSAPRTRIDPARVPVPGRRG